MTSPDTTALRAAIIPIAAYCARTPAPNAHADRCATLVNAAADYVEAVEATPTGPDWAAVAYFLLTRCAVPASAPASPWAVFAAAQLARMAFQARRALPLAQRMALASLNSHYLDSPDSF